MPTHTRPKKPEEGSSAYSVPAVHRTLDIIEALIKVRMITVSEVNQQFKMPKSSAYAILQTLKAGGYMHKDEQDCYSLTLQLGDISTFSFQSFKLMTAGEGGMIMSHSDELIDKCWSYCNQG